MDHGAYLVKLMSAFKKLPRFAGAANKLFRRTPFLNGTQKTYFSPQVIGVPVYPPGFPNNNLPSYPLVWPFGMSDFGTYSAPSTWPQSGQLLRAPQVACFSFQINPDIALDLETGVVAYDYWSGLDFVGIAPTVKSTIESLRPGKTFVNMCCHYGVIYPLGSFNGGLCDSGFFNGQFRLLGDHATADPPPYPRDYFYTYFPYQSIGPIWWCTNIPMDDCSKFFRGFFWH